MADLFCSFMYFRSLTNTHNLPLFLPPKLYYSSPLHSHNSRINTIKRSSRHLPLLLKPSPFTASASDIDIISTHEHSDGSFLFRFGDPSEIQKNAEVEVSKDVEEEIEGDDNNKFSVVKGDDETEVTEAIDSRDFIVSSSNAAIAVEGETDLFEKLLESDGSVVKAVKGDDETEVTETIDTADVIVSSINVAISVERESDLSDKLLESDGFVVKVVKGDHENEVTEAIDSADLIVSNSNAIIAVEGETELSEKLLESSDDDELPLLYSNEEMGGIPTLDLGIEHIENVEGLNEKFEDSSPVGASISDESLPYEESRVEASNVTSTSKEMESTSIPGVDVEEKTVNVVECVDQEDVGSLTVASILDQRSELMDEITTMALSEKGNDDITSTYTEADQTGKVEECLNQEDEDSLEDESILDHSSEVMEYISTVAMSEKESDDITSADVQVDQTRKVEEFLNQEESRIDQSSAVVDNISTVALLEKESDGITSADVEVDQTQKVEECLNQEDDDSPENDSMLDQSSKVVDKISTVALSDKDALDEADQTGKVVGVLNEDYEDSPVDETLLDESPEVVNGISVVVLLEKETDDVTSISDIDIEPTGNVEEGISEEYKDSPVDTPVLDKTSEILNSISITTEASLQMETADITSVLDIEIENTDNVELGPDEVHEEPSPVEQCLDGNHEEPSAVEQVLDEVHDKPSSVEQGLDEVREEPSAVEQGDLDEAHEEPSAVDRVLDEVHVEPSAVEQVLGEVREEPSSVKQGLDEIREEPSAVEQGDLDEVHEEPNAVEQVLDEVHEEPSAVEQVLYEVREEPSSVEQGLVEVRDEPGAVEQCDLDEVHEEPSAVAQVLDEIHEEPSAVEQGLDEVREEPSAVEQGLDDVRKEQSAADQGDLDEVHEEPSAMEQVLDEVHVEPSAVEQVLDEVREEPSAVEQGLDEVREEQSAVDQGDLDEIREEPSAVEQVLYEVHEEPSSVEQGLDEVREEQSAVDQGDLDEVREEPSTVEQVLYEVREEPSSVEQGLDEVREGPNAVEQGDLDEVHEEPSAVEQVLDEVHEEPSAVEQGLDEIREEPSAVEQGLDEVREEPSAVKQGLDEVHEERSTVEQGIDEVQEGPSAVEQGLDEVREEPSPVNASKPDDNITAQDFEKETADPIILVDLKTEPVDAVLETDAYQGSLVNAVTTILALSEHQNVETAVQDGTIGNDEDNHDDNLVSPSPQMESEPAMSSYKDTKESNSQKLATEENRETELNAKALEEQTVIGIDNGSEIYDADAESPTTGSVEQASEYRSGVPDEIVGYISDDMIQLLTVPPQLEADSMLVKESGIQSMEDPKEDAASENETVGGDLVEASVHEVTVPESAESIITRQETLLSDFVLSSGATLLPHPSKVSTGGEDAYFVAGQTWLGVADGVSQWSLEETIPGDYAHELIKNCEKLISGCNGTSINNPIELLNLSVAQTHSPGSSTVLIAQFDGQALHIANIGDSGFIVLRHGTVYKRSSPMHHAFSLPVHIERGENPSSLAQLYRIDLEEEDVIVVATDGLLDNLYDQEISLITMKSLADNKSLEEIGELLANKAQEVGSSASARSPFADEAQAAGFPGYTGGKLDDVAVIVSLVQRI